jgi:UDP-perosamine 4-acetyltransferase
MGAGGHSREVADLIVACGHQVAGFSDAVLSGTHRPTGIPISADVSSIEAEAVTIAVGDPRVRERLFDETRQSLLMPSLVHPSACVSPHAAIGDGVQVMQNVVVSATAVVGCNVILNVACFVAHDCEVGAHTHVAPGVLMSGESSVGRCSTLGAGAILLPGVRVGDGCTVGAGAVVTADVADGETVVGIPARPIGGDR